MDCMDCGQQIDPSDFPDFVDVAYARRCVKCVVIALWLLVMEVLDDLALCPDCGEPWPETIRADGSLGCPCQEAA